MARKRARPRPTAGDGEVVAREPGRGSPMARVLRPRQAEADAWWMRSEGRCDSAGGRCRDDRRLGRRRSRWPRRCRASTECAARGAPRPRSRGRDAVAELVEPRAQEPPPPRAQELGRAIRRAYRRASREGSQALPIRWSSSHGRVEQKLQFAELWGTDFAALAFERRVSSRTGVAGSSGRRSTNPRDKRNSRTADCRLERRPSVWVEAPGRSDQCATGRAPARHGEQVADDLTGSRWRRRR